MRMRWEGGYYVRGDGVFFDEGFFGEVELEGVVGGEGDVEAAAEVVVEGVSVI